MRSISALTLLSAMGAAVNAAPTMDRRQTENGLISQKAPFQDFETLPPLNGATLVSADMGNFANMNLPSDLVKCHGSCGMVIRIGRTPESCKHPWAKVFVDFCFGTCGVLKEFTPYESAKTFKNTCNLNVQVRSSTVAEVASTTANVPSSTGSSLPASTTDVLVPRPTSSAAPSSAAPSNAAPSESSIVSSSSRIPASTPTSSALPTGTTATRPSHPSGVASGTGASTSPRATSTNAGPVTAGAASTSFSVIAAITVATLAMVIA